MAAIRAAIRIGDGAPPVATGIVLERLAGGRP
jgi:hypothetical protein